MTHRVAGLIYGPMEHYLDHLAPLCALLGIPLILSDEKLLEMGKRFYPDLDAQLLPPAHLPEAVITHFDILITCTPRDLFDETFFLAQQLHQKRLITIWCPHGNSDKGSTSSDYMKGLKKEEGALVYGEQMIDVLKEKGVFDQLKGHLEVGNYRFEYFKKHHAFYTSLARSHIERKLPAGKKTILYAPTWQDHAHNGSFFDAAPSLIEDLPKEYNLIIKLHPNIRRLEEPRLEALLEPHPNVLFLEEYPPIYSLLNLSDLYIGDMSSIGYDYLSFDRPLFFLSQREDLQTTPHLIQTGSLIAREDYDKIYQRIFEFFEFETRDFSLIRQTVYNYTFAPTPTNLCQEFHTLCETLLKTSAPYF